MPVRFPAEKIIVKCPNWVGDLVAATGALRCLRLNYPLAHILLLAKPSLGPLLEGSPRHDQLILYERHESSPEQRRSAKREIRRRGFDLAILLSHGFSTRFLLWRAGIAERVGIAPTARSLFLTERITVSRLKAGRPYVSKVELYQTLCERLGCEDAQDQRPELFVPDEADHRAEALLAQSGRRPDRKLVGVVPGARYGASKRWPPDRFAALSDKLIRELDCDTLLITAPSEKDVAHAVAAAMVERPLRLPENGTDLTTLKGLIRRCDLLVGNDTGPRHIAVAFGVPAVTLMGPTDPAVTESPYEKGAIVRQKVPCAPCYRRECPTDHICMTSIPVERVYEQARKRLV